MTIINSQYLFPRYLLRYTIISFLIISGCSTRYDGSNVHPVGRDLFQAPIIELDNYKSAHLRPSNRTDLALAVAISGGGERAANFGIGVLQGLEDIGSLNSEDDLLKEVDYFSTVSGGGMAVAAYYSALYSHIKNHGKDRQSFTLEKALRMPKGYQNKKVHDDNCRNKNAETYYATFSDADRAEQITDPCLRRHLERGYEGNIIKSLSDLKILFSDLDRGDVLEDTFARELVGELWNRRSKEENGQLTMGDLFIGKSDEDREPLFPQWTPNATIIENGAIFPFTPRIFDKYHISEYVHKLESAKKPKDVAHYEFAMQVPISLGLTASGNFPSLITPQTLTSDQDDSEERRNSYLHLIDGGVSDNLGIFSVLSMMNQQGTISEQHKKSHKSVVKRKVLIVVDAYPGNFSPYSISKGGPFWWQVYYKLPEMPLDGQRSRALEYIRQTSCAKDFSAIYISFDELYRPKSDKEPYVEDYESGAVKNLFITIQSYYMDMPASLKKELIADLHKQHKELTPFQIARNVKTSYNVSRAEQEFLIAVGRYLVAENQEKILKAVKLNSDFAVAGNSLCKE